MSPRPSITIAPPQNQADLAAVRALFIEYAESLGFSLSYQGFETELAELPGRYTPPTGALLLARSDGVEAGVVALRQLSPEICEMKRLDVRPAHRSLRTNEGLPIGRALTLGIVGAARTLGYRRLRLDTIAGKVKWTPPSACTPRSGSRRSSPTTRARSRTRSTWS